VEFAVKRLAWLAAGLVMLATAFGVWYFSGAGRALREAAQAAKGVKADVSVKGLTLSQGKEGKLSWTLEAESAEYMQEQGRVRVKSPRIVYFSERANATRQEVRVSAPQGEVSQEREEADLGPQVRVESGGGVVWADALHYSGKEKIIRLTGHVRVERQDMQLNATEMVVDLKSNEVRALGGVEGLFSAFEPAPAKEAGP
jgi:LPS export ABC transporter protein LptC